MPRLPLLPALVAALVAALIGFLVVSSVLAAGPPFPDPVPDQAVYDPAGAIRPETEAELERIIDAIEARSGAEIAVYLQLNPGVSPSQNEENARALMDQWGVGRAGFDDGLVILFDLEPTLVNGRVAIQTGGGFDAVYLDADGRDRILDDFMIPHLRQQDVDGALLAALHELDRLVDADGQTRLERARILEALLTLIGAPLVLIGTVGIAALSWYTTGRDPRFLDSESILMAGPPAGMTPALASAITEGRSDQQAMTAGLMELGRRGFLRFISEGEGKGDQLSLELLGEGADLEPYKPLSKAERYLLERLQALLPRSATEAPGATADWILAPAELTKLGRHADTFHKRLEQEGVDLGWFSELPHRSVKRWARVGTAELVIAGLLIFFAFDIPMFSLLWIGIALGLGGLFTLAASEWMPQRTKEGARVDGMLKAYRRTLRKTLEQSRSMEQVVADPVVHAWTDTPDKAMVWGVALGLRQEVAGVLERSLADRSEGTAHDTWYPHWVAQPSSGGSWTAGHASASGVRALFSASPIPNVNAMLNTIGTIGTPPSSSGGGGGGGGFSGGSSSGGGSSSRGF